MTTDAIKALVEEVKAHARANYETGGWDVVVECHTDAEIAEAIGQATTSKGAIANVARAFGLRAYNAYRRDIEAERF